MLRSTQETADHLNSAILADHDLPPTCALERLLRQLVATSDALRETNHGYGDCLSLSASVVEDGEARAPLGGGDGSQGARDMDVER